jgi:hypothetical protein
MSKIEKIEFNEIKDTILNNGEYYERLDIMSKKLTDLATAWNVIASAATKKDGDAAYKVLMEQSIKIVDITGIDAKDKVFLGGSRKKRQSKKRKNHKKHNNNQ